MIGDPALRRSPQRSVLRHLDVLIERDEQLALAESTTVPDDVRAHCVAVLTMAGVDREAGGTVLEMLDRLFSARGAVQRDLIDDDQLREQLERDLELERLWLEDPRNAWRQSA